MTQTINTMSSQEQEDANLYRLYQALLTEGDTPTIDTHAPFGAWLDTAMQMHQARVRYGVPGVKAYVRSINNLKQKTPLDKRLITLLSSEPPAVHLSTAKAKSICPQMIVRERATVPTLPEAAHLPSGLSQGASPWIDEYISYSRLASPEGYEDFHSACGLWVLSTVAARRVCLRLQRKTIYPSLMLVLTARTTLFAKTTTAEVAKDLL